MNQQLVTLTPNNEAVTTSLGIADGTDNEHKAVIQLVRNYQSDLEDFGPLTFEMVKGKALPQGGFAKSTEYAILNEDQATLLITYMRNSEIVRTFKKRLVKEFRNMHNQLNRPLSKLEIAEQLVESLRREEQSQIELAAKQQKIDEDAPKVKLYDEVMDADTEHTFATVAGFIGCLEEELTMFCKHAMWLQSDVKGRVPTYKAKNEKWIIPTLGKESGMAVFTARGVEKVLNSVEKLKEGSPLMWSRIFGDAKQYGRKFKLDQKRRMDEFVAYVEERKMKQEPK